MRMDQFEALKAICTARHSVREFSDRPVPDDAVDRILEIAKTSPYAGGSKSWRLLVVRDKALIREAARLVRRRVEELGTGMRPAFRAEFAEYARSFSVFERAPLLLVPTFRAVPALSLMLAEPEENIVRMENESFVKSISCVAMLILLAAQSLGLGSCYMTGPLVAESAMAKLFQVSSGHRIAAILPLGYGKEG